MIGKRIKLFRKKAGLTGAELGVLSNTAQTTISELELDKRSPTLDTLLKICKALNITIFDLLPDELSNTNNETLIRMIKIFEQLTPEEQMKLVELIEVMIKR